MTSLLPAWVRLVNGVMVAIPERAAVIKRIFTLAGEGYGRSRIVRLLTDEKVPAFGPSGKHRVEVLGLGATMRLIAEGLVEVRALEDAEALQKAKPDKDGIDVAANAAREEQIARRLTGTDGLVVLILGGHDLTAALRRQAPGLRYLRVATKAYVGTQD
jgi:hypothetical protein